MCVSSAPWQFLLDGVGNTASQWEDPSPPGLDRLQDPAAVRFWGPDTALTTLRPRFPPNPCPGKKGCPNTEIITEKVECWILFKHQRGEWFMS